MTREEALRVLVKMRAWRRWGKGEQNEKDRPEMPEQKEVDEAFNVCIEMLSKVSLPSSLDEAATNYAWEEQEMVYKYDHNYKNAFIDVNNARFVARCLTREANKFWEKFDALYLYGADIKAEG